MKRKIAIAVTCLLASSLVLGGCGSRSSESGSSTSAEEENRTVKSKELLSALDYKVQQYVTLPKNYDSLDISLEDKYEVTEDDVIEYAESMMLYYPAYEETNKKTVGKSSIVNIDYTGTMDGEEFDGGSAEDTYLEIGSDTMIDGFEDGLVGAKVGETVTLDLTFPDDYSSEDLAGQDATFEVTINAIVKEVTLTYDEITDAYVEENFYDYYGLETVDDFYDYLEDSLEESMESEEESDLSEAILEKLKEESTVEFPDGLVEGYVETTITSLEEYAESADMTADEYCEEYLDMTEEEYEEQLTEEVEDSVTEELILQMIIRKNKTSIETDDFYSFAEQYVTYYGYYYGYDSVDDFYEAQGSKELAMLRYAEQVVLEELIANANVTYDAESTEDEETTDESEEEDSEDEDSSDEDSSDDSEDSEE